MELAKDTRFLSTTWYVDFPHYQVLEPFMSCVVPATNLHTHHYGRANNSKDKQNVAMSSVIRG